VLQPDPGLTQSAEAGTMLSRMVSPQMIGSLGQFVFRFDMVETIVSEDGS
jgi:hypothetical protein